MSPARRVACALLGSASIVILIATLLPRAFLVNDDPGLVVTLRLGATVGSSWMSPVLNRMLVSLYDVAPAVPWYGLYCYGLIVATGAVVIHTCLELIDPRPGVGRVATVLGATMLVASHVILVVGVTWTTVTIAALGTATVAFVAHLLTCQATQKPASWPRALIYGLLFVAGFALREQGLIAAVAALVPLLGWVGIELVRRRHLPRPAAVVAFIAPFAIVLAIQNRIPQSLGADPQYEAFNWQRGRISDVAAFSGLDKRAPELLERAGWTLDDYRDFGSWRLTDETQFSAEKVRRLADTGGAPVARTLADVYDLLRGIVVESAASVWLFLSLVAVGCLLAWLGVIDRKRGFLFCLGNLAALTIMPVAITVLTRFPQRVSLQFYTVAAFGVFVVLAHEIAKQPARANTGRRGIVALLAISLFMFMWARNLIAWADRGSSPYHSTLRQFADRVKARNGLVMGGLGGAEVDPLLADPVGYAALPGGWGTFTYPWFEYIHRFGIRSGSELLHKMVDNPDAYVVASPWGHEDFEDWFRRRLGNPAIRLALVDVAWGMPPSLRSELYRLVTTPVVQGDEEWQLAARNYALDLAPAAADVSDRTFRSVAFTAPYEKHLSSVVRPAPSVSITPVDHGIRYTLMGTTHCTSLAYEPEHVGIHVPVKGLAAARIDIALFDPENILGVYVYAFADNHRSIRWRWELDSFARAHGFDGKLTLVPGHPGYPFALVDDTADAEQISAIDLVIAVVPGTHAGFELRNLEISEP